MGEKFSFQKSINYISLVFLIFIFLYLTFYFFVFKDKGIQNIKSRICIDSRLIWRKELTRDILQLKSVIREIQNSAEYINDKNLFLKCNNCNLEECKFSILTNYWFLKHNGYISFRDSMVEVNYKECSYFKTEINAYLINSKQGLRAFRINEFVKIEDSISLDSNWYYIVTSCENCGD